MMHQTLVEVHVVESKKHFGQKECLALVKCMLGFELVLQFRVEVFGRTAE